jgi:tetratricopeptide (TPR) repeat protein
MLQEAQSGDVISSKKAECFGEAEIPAKIDELTSKIKYDLNLSQEQIASDVDRYVSEITTSSPEALKFYVEGYIFHLREEWRNAIQSFEKAVSVDPDFASAYRKMAVEYSNLGYTAKSRECFKKAFELRNRVSDREKYQIEGDHYRQSWRTYDKAIKAYEELLKLYAEDNIGNNNLGVLYGTIDEHDKALQHFYVTFITRKRDKRPAPNCTGNLASLYARKGLYDKAEEVLQYHLDNFPDNVYIRSMLALNNLSQKKYDLALIHADRAYSMNPKYSRAILIKGDTYFCMEDFVNAEVAYQRLLQLEEPRQHLRGMRHLISLNLALGKFGQMMKYAKRAVELSGRIGEKEYEAEFHIHLANAYLKSGKTENALSECEKAMGASLEVDSYTWQRNFLHFRGLILVEMEAFKEAEETADDLKTLIDLSMNKKGMRFYYHLMGQIELSKGNIPKALKHLGDAISLLPFHHQVDQYAFIFEPLAQTHFSSGNIDKAEELYKEIKSITIDRVFVGEAYAKSFYMLGKIYEEQGRTAKTIEHYNKFLDLWKDADPGIVEVEDARKRLAGLRR